MEIAHTENTGIIFKIKADGKSAAFIQAIEEIGNQFYLGV